MLYHPYGYRIGFRDIVAAWVFCLVMAAAGLSAETVVTAARPASNTAPALTAPADTSGALICKADTRAVAAQHG